MSRDRFKELQTTSRPSRQQSSQRTLNSVPSQSSTFYDAVTEKISQYIERIDRNIDTIAKYHEKALVSVSQDEIKRANRELDELQNETSDLIDRARSMLNTVGQETKRITGTEVQARSAQQNALARRLIESGRNYARIQDKYKDKYKDRMKRELKIARPDASSSEIERAVESGNANVFAQQMLSSRLQDQRRVLQEMEGRHQEIMRIEQSVEQLANLFQDMQVLLEQQQETINVIDTHVDEVTKDLERGGQEIGKAIEYRVASRSKLWWITGIILVIIIILAAVAYMQRCSWFGVQCPKNP